MEPFQALAWESHYADGSTHIDVYPLGTDDERAIAGMLIQEKERGLVTGWTKRRVDVRPVTNQ